MGRFTSILGTAISTLGNIELGVVPPAPPPSPPIDPEVVTPEEEEGNIPPPPADGIPVPGMYVYLYVVTPAQPPQKFTPQGILMQPMQNNYDWANAPDQLIERSMAQFNVSGDRKDLIDGRRVYRVTQQDVSRFPKDGIGFFVGVLPAPPGVVFRFVKNDPSVGLAFTRDWQPVGLGDKTTTYGTVLTGTYQGR